MKSFRSHPRRAFSLLECVAVVAVLAVAVPVTLSFMDESASNRADAVNAARATVLGSAVMEHVLADVQSATGTQGFTSLANSSAYLSTATTGLYDRMLPVSAPYTTAGLTYAVTIGSLESFNGTVTGGAADVFRSVTVTVTYPSARGGNLSVSLTSRVAKL